MSLEPMNPYERRIIHATVSDIDGVFSKSIGDYPTRRVIITSESAKRPPHNKKPSSSGGNKSERKPAKNSDPTPKPGGGNTPKKNSSGRPAESKNKKPPFEKKYDKNYEVKKPATTNPSTYDFEKEFLKKQNRDDKNVQLYSKIENTEDDK